MSDIVSYTNLTHKIDTLVSYANSTLEMQQVQSTKMKSICDVTASLSDGQSAMHAVIDTIRTRLNDISAYGVGYNDSTALITIPLIIALFAFAFPFLFTVIPHINNKYKSEHITKLFSSEPAYKWFMRASTLSAIYLIATAVLTLCRTSSNYRWIVPSIDITSILIAGGYALTVLFFVRTCIDYNSQNKLIERIDAKYNRGIKKSDSYLCKLKREEKRITKKKASEELRFKSQRISLGKSYAFYGVEESRTRDFIELCRYAIRQGEYTFFQDVLLKFDNLPHADKKYKNQRFLFYEEVVDAYLEEVPNDKIDAPLIRHWFSSFNKAEEPNRGIIYRMLGKVVSAAKSGHFGLFEQYVQNSNYGYNFINHLQIESYVRGDNVETQKKIDKNRLDLWLELCEMHYLALAHLFSAGIFEPLKVILSGRNSGYGRLFPSSGTGVLKLYARCKENQEEDGSFGHYMLLDKVIGDSPDSEMLEKLTSMMLLVKSTESFQGMNLISQFRLELIRKNEGVLTGFANTWIDNSELKYMFPQIAGIDFSLRLQHLIQQFEGADSEKYRDNPVEGIKDNIYHQDVSDMIIGEIKTMFWNILYGNQGNITDNLIGPEDDNKTECMPMGEWAVTIHKYILIESGGLYVHKIFHNVSRVFQSRYLMMVYSALSKMDATDVSMPINKFGEYFDKLVGVNGDEYFIIDSDSHMDLFYTMDKKDESRRFNLERTYKGAGYKFYDLNVGWYMNDIPELDSFKETLVIIKKKNLPFIAATTEPVDPNVQIYDESDKEKGIAAVSLIVNPNFGMRYNKTAQFYRFRLTTVQ